MKSLLRDMGWIHWRDELPPNSYKKEILELSNYLSSACVVWGADFHHRLLTLRQGGATVAELDCFFWWMPVPIVPRRVLQELVHNAER